MSVIEAPTNQFGFTPDELINPTEDTWRRVFDGQLDNPPHVELHATLGPYTDDSAVLAKIIPIGDRFRVNGGQNSVEETEQRITHFRTVLADIPTSVLSDEQKRLKIIEFDPAGPKDRIDDSMVGRREVEPGDLVIFQHKDRIADGQTDRIPLADDLSQVLLVDQSDQPMSMFDGALGWSIRRVDRENGLFVAEANGFGSFGRRQGINLPDAKFKAGYIEDDRERLRKLGPFLGGRAVDYVIVSFAQGSKDIDNARADGAAFGLRDVLYGGKIEDKNGMENSHDTVRSSDIVVVAQGDLPPMVGANRTLASMLRLGAMAGEYDTEWVVATGMMESVRDGRTARPSDLGYVGMVAAFGGQVWLSAEIAMNKDNVSVMEQSRKQVDSYAGQAMMLFMAMPKEFRMRLVHSAMAGNGNGNGINY